MLRGGLQRRGREIKIDRNIATTRWPNAKFLWRYFPLGKPEFSGTAGIAGVIFAEAFEVGDKIVFYGTFALKMNTTGDFSSWRERRITETVRRSKITPGDGFHKKQQARAREQNQDGPKESERHRPGVDHVQRLFQGIEQKDS